MLILTTRRANSQAPNQGVFIGTCDVSKGIYWLLGNERKRYRIRKRTFFGLFWLTFAASRGKSVFVDTSQAGITAFIPGSQFHGRIRSLLITNIEATESAQTHEYQDSSTRDCGYSTVTSFTVGILSISMIRVRGARRSRRNVPVGGPESSSS